MIAINISDKRSRRKASLQSNIQFLNWVTLIPSIKHTFFNDCSFTHPAFSLPVLVCRMPGALWFCNLVFEFIVTLWTLPRASTQLGSTLAPSLMFFACRIKVARASNAAVQTHAQNEPSFQTVRSSYGVSHLPLSEQRWPSTDFQEQLKKLYPDLVLSLQSICSLTTGDVHNCTEALPADTFLCTRTCGDSATCFHKWAWWIS